jgi:hypothetical protein
LLLVQIAIALSQLVKPAPTTIGTTAVTATAAGMVWMTQPTTNLLMQNKGERINETSGSQHPDTDLGMLNFLSIKNKAKA